MSRLTDLQWLFEQQETATLTWRGHTLTGCFQRDELGALTADAGLPANNLVTFTCPALADKEPPGVNDTATQHRAPLPTLTWFITKSTPLGGGTAWKLYLRESNSGA